MELASAQLYNVHLDIKVPDSDRSRSTGQRRCAPPLRTAVLTAWPSVLAGVVMAKVDAICRAEAAAAGEADGNGHAGHTGSSHGALVVLCPAANERPRPAPPRSQAESSTTA